MPVNFRETVGPVKGSFLRFLDFRAQPRMMPAVPASGRQSGGKTTIEVDGSLLLLAQRAQQRGRHGRADRG
jgi:hypothetical protein